ncbi:MAG: aminodeoxychorismate synthase component I [Ignavibacteriaceae bacterium]|nr:aminodeoxychorismate synthase component I [Ignavibacteriaceae bacterium]
MNFDDIIRSVEQNTYSAFFYTSSVYKKALSYLFLKPIEIITVYKKEDLDFSFKLIHKLINKGYFGYSLIKYEAGFLFEEKLANLIDNDSEKLIQFFFFEKREVKKLKSSKIIIDDFKPNNYSVSDFTLNRTEDEFVSDIGKIKNSIKAGDTYQVNYTVKGKFNFNGSYSSFFQKLLFNQSAKYSAFINNNDEFILSLSPELFFYQKNKKIISHPMKGTIRRGYNENSDRISETKLRKSEKNVSENVMIVDLIRNDLGRICRYGSVTAPELFRIEKYESLFQMVSEVRGKLKKKMDIRRIVQNIFPCGSVTGAPKIRTMEIINEIEKEKRGIYTGSIGLITSNDIKMNVVIRTILINRKSGEGIVGLGSGIVWYSDPRDEYEEVLLKSRFLTEPLNYFEIFETMKYNNGEIIFLNDHLARMKLAANYFLFRFNEKKIRKQIESIISNIDKRQNKKIRLALTKWGKVRIDVSIISRLPKNVSVIVSQNKINSKDKFRYFKTTSRKLYDEEYSEYNSKGFYEVLYFNERDELVEGSRTNIFIKKENSWFTPSLESGALPGIYRKYFIDMYPNVIEKNIKYEEIVNADELFLTNALRGEVKVNKLFITPNEFISYDK